MMDNEQLPPAGVRCMCVLTGCRAGLDARTTAATAKRTLRLPVGRTMPARTTSR